MPNASAPIREKFLEIETTYQAAIQWWWTEPKLHDNDYGFRVQDAVNDKVAEVVKRYASVRQDTRFCCQWEGVQLEGSNLEEVTAAAREVATVLSRFKYVRPLCD